jgi:hypothetical protein
VGWIHLAAGSCGPGNERILFASAQHVPPALTYQNSAFCPLGLFVCSQQATIGSALQRAFRDIRGFFTNQLTCHKRLTTKLWSNGEIRLRLICEYVNAKYTNPIDFVYFSVLCTKHCRTSPLLSFRLWSRC